ncbi:hypothetical protein K432DRAFT_210154 [Lepidopterella palustris CBS 459.81]|uniref:Uncharacterized protein n=1 Tax=Lepidopterella palustris CBS 459.81 TaxID=1314670 RepID=A0A8E2JHL4_9PEZI|nr:hypothetical protein K432DRAFT_210154 [Lepidopterella palustris CBS 459.81]
MSTRAVSPCSCSFAVAPFAVAPFAVAPFAVAPFAVAPFAVTLCSYFWQLLLAVTSGSYVLISSSFPPTSHLLVGLLLVTHEAPFCSARPMVLAVKIFTQRIQSGL